MVAIEPEDTLELQKRKKARKTSAMDLDASEWLKGVNKQGKFDGKLIAMYQNQFSRAGDCVAITLCGFNSLRVLRLVLNACIADLRNYGLRWSCGLASSMEGLKGSICFKREQVTAHHVPLCQSYTHSSLHSYKIHFVRVECILSYSKRRFEPTDCIMSYAPS